MEKVDAIEVEIREAELGYNSFLGKHFKAYRATDVDPLRSDVRALVEDLKESSRLLHSINWATGTIPFKATLLVDKALAAVERYLEEV